MRIQIGDELPSLTKVITSELLIRYGALTGDRDSKHVNPEAAAQTPYKVPIMQGNFTEAFVAQLLANWLPKPQAWFTGGTLTTKFTGPVVAGDTIIFTGTVVQVEELEGQQRVVCDVAATNQRGEMALVGEASFSL